MITCEPWARHMPPMQACLPCDSRLKPDTSKLAKVCAAAQGQLNSARQQVIPNHSSQLAEDSSVPASVLTPASDTQNKFKTEVYEM